MHGCVRPVSVGVHVEFYHLEIGSLGGSRREAQFLYCLGRSETERFVSQSSSLTTQSNGHRTWTVAVEAASSETKAVQGAVTTEIDGNLNST